MFLLCHLCRARLRLFIKAGRPGPLILVCGFLLCACSSSSDNRDEEEQRAVQPPPVQSTPVQPPVQPPPVQSTPVQPPPIDEPSPISTTTSPPQKTTETIDDLRARLHRLIQQTDTMLLKADSHAFDWSVFPQPEQIDLQARIIQQSSAVQHVRQRLSASPAEDSP